MTVLMTVVGSPFPASAALESFDRGDLNRDGGGDRWGRVGIAKAWGVCDKLVAVRGCLGDFPQGVLDADQSGEYFTGHKDRRPDPIPSHFICLAHEGFANFEVPQPFFREPELPKRRGRVEGVTTEHPGEAILQRTEQGGDLGILPLYAEGLSLIGRVPKCLGAVEPEAVDGGLRVEWASDSASTTLAMEFLSPPAAPVPWAFRRPAARLPAATRVSLCSGPYNRCWISRFLRKMGIPIWGLSLET